MVEDIGKVISNGFETYTKNLNLSIPFILNILVTGIIAVILFIVGISYIFGPAIPSLERLTSPEEMMSVLLPVVMQNIYTIVFTVILFILLGVFVQSFFTAGAIGMAKQATETGSSSLSTMIESGKENVINLFLAEIMVGLLILAGIVFVVPGILNTSTRLMLIGGLLLWILYILIINIVLAVYRYALVVDALGPVDGVLAGYRFFTKHKMEVFLMVLFLFAIAVAMFIINLIMGFIPIIGLIWPLINLILSLLVVPALTTVWWVRLYTSGTLTETP